MQFLCKWRIFKYVKGFKIINERICCLRLKAKWFSGTLVNVHAPTSKKMEEIKEQFYNLLEQNVTQIARSDIKIIFEDWKGYVVKHYYIN